MQFHRFSVTAFAAFLPLLLAACVGAPPVQPKPPVEQKIPAKPAETFRPVGFQDLPGWASDDVRQAWPAFLASCEVLGKKPDWQPACGAARGVDAADEAAVRAYFERYFAPSQVINPDGSETGLITGYYEPFLRGMRRRAGAFQTPLYAVPDDLLTIDLAGLYPELKNMRLRGRLVGKKIVPYYSRAELEQSGSLAGNELMWIDDTIDAFFLQVQGSGRVQLLDTGEIVRVAYADQNGYPYRSIGRYLVDKGELTLDQASAQSIKSWFLANPSRRQELLNANPSYVFFKEEKIADPTVGPKGAMGIPLTPERSAAVDPQSIPLGVPLFISTTYPGQEMPLRRLVIAQDTGGAIRGAVRADFFWGFGPDAGEKAGRMKQRGMLWVLLPKQLVSVAARSKEP